MILDDFQNAGPAEALERFGIHVFPADLCLKESKTHRPSDLQRETFEVSFRGTDPKQRLQSWTVTHSMPNLA